MQKKNQFYDKKSVEIWQCAVIASLKMSKNVPVIHFKYLLYWRSYVFCFYDPFFRFNSMPIQFDKSEKLKKKINTKSSCKHFENVFLIICLCWFAQQINEYWNMIKLKKFNISKKMLKMSFQGKKELIWNRFSASSHR